MRHSAVSTPVAGASSEVARVAGARRRSAAVFCPAGARREKKEPATSVDQARRARRAPLGPTCQLH